MRAQRTITGIHEVYGEIYQQIGFDRLWGQSSRFFARKEILKHITLARIAQPDSKRAGVAAGQEKTSQKTDAKGMWETYWIS